MIYLAMRFLAAATIAAFLASVTFGDETPASIASHVKDVDVSALSAILSAAIDSSDPLTRATAARIVTVRNVVGLIPKVRDRLGRETDPDAAREEVRALVIAGNRDDVDLAIALTRAMPRGINAVIMRAISRRSDALELLPKIRDLQLSPDVAFMTQAFWQVPIASVVAGARFVGSQDATSWTALLKTLLGSGLAMEPNVVAASLTSSSEDIRTASVWYLIHGYGLDPSKLSPYLRTAIDAPKEEASLREGFGREILRRMIGGTAVSDPRWIAWLQTKEADELIGSESVLFQYFTDDEFIVRKRYCDIASSDCRMPPTRKTTYASTLVTQPEFSLPASLPRGLADSIVREQKCSRGWLAVASAKADRAGRIQETKIQPLASDERCVAAADQLMRLSFATPVSMEVRSEAHGILLVQSATASTCIDESPLEEGDLGLYRTGGDVKAPIVKRRVEPNFPMSARMKMGPNTDVNVVVESVISKTGCVRSIQLISQSPFPELNGAALQAIAQWTFIPGRLGSVPIDTIFNLTVHYKMSH